MANTLLTPTAVTREALRILHQKLNFVGSITREYDESYAKSGAKIGDTLKIRLPNQYTVRTGRNLSTQDTTENSVSLQVATQKGVDVTFNAAELGLSLDDFSKRILDPAMSVLGANIEADAMSMYNDISQSVWNMGSAATFSKLLAGRKVMQDSLTPLNDRTANLNTQDNVDLVDALKGLFNDTTQIAKQYREGYMGRTAGFDFVENTLWPSHTRGGANSAYTANTTALSNGQTTITVATGTGTLNQGDVITIAGLKKAHPESKANTGIDMQFVVTSNYVGGGGTVNIAPAIYTSGPLQNVVAAATGATQAVTVLGAAGTTGTSMLYQEGAFAFATADLQMPQGVDFARREVLDGVSMRIVRQYSISDDTFPCRIDVLYGYKTIRPQLACRVHNN